MSLREMTWQQICISIGSLTIAHSKDHQGQVKRKETRRKRRYTVLSCVGADAHVFVLEVLEQLELTVCALCEHRCAERLHDLLDCDILVGKLIPGRAVAKGTVSVGCAGSVGTSKGAYQTRPKAPMPTGWRSEYLREIGSVLRWLSASNVWSLPGGDLECGAKDLGAYELSHGEYVILLDDMFEGDEKK
jgi:hypothetical protein